MDRRQLDKYIGPGSVDVWCSTQTFANDMLSNALKVTTGSDLITVRADMPTIYCSNTDICKEEFNRRPTMKNETKTTKPKFVDVKRIIHSGPCTIVFWEDNTKTVVRCSENDIYDEYSAFCSALAIKLYGTNSHLKKVIERVSKK